MSESRYHLTEKRDFPRIENLRPGARGRIRISLLLSFRDTCIVVWACVRKRSGSGWNLLIHPPCVCASLPEVVPGFLRQRVAFCGPRGKWWWINSCCRSERLRLIYSWRCRRSGLMMQGTFLLLSSSHFALPPFSWAFLLRFLRIAGCSCFRHLTLRNCRYLLGVFLRPASRFLIFL